MNLAHKNYLAAKPSTYDATPFFNVKTIGRSGQSKWRPSTLLAAARHNRRQIQHELGAASRIDVTRTSKNLVLAGPLSADGIVDLATHLMIEAGIDSSKLRKDHVQAIELVFSLPADFHKKSNIDLEAYFHWCLAWTRDHFPTCPVLSADLHLDESAPHCHVLLLPLSDGKMRGSMLLKKPELQRHRESFEKDVHRQFGFRKAPPRINGVARWKACKLVTTRLEALRDPGLQSALWGVLKAAIEQDPRASLSALGLEPSQPPMAKKLRTMAAIFTSRGRGPKVDSKAVRQTFATATPLAVLEPGPKTSFARADHPFVTAKERACIEQSPSCVAFAGHNDSPSSELDTHFSPTTARKTGDQHGQ